MQLTALGWPVNRGGLAIVALGVMTSCGSGAGSAGSDGAPGPSSSSSGGTGSGSAGGPSDGSSGNGSGWSANLSGGALVILASGQTNPFGIAVSSARAYWVNYDVGVMTVPTTGGTVTTLAAGYTSINVALDSKNVYWGSGMPACPTDDGGCVGTDSTVMRVPLGGGVPTTLASWVHTTGSPATSVAVDSTSVYWTTAWEPSSIQSVSLGGGSPTIRYNDPGGNQAGGRDPYAIAAGGGRVYWTASGSDNAGSYGSIVSMPVGGGAPLTLVSESGWLASVAVDATNVYWTNYGASHEPTNTDGRVMKVPLRGGKPTTLASGQHDPSAIAVDATNVYWGNAGTVGDGYADGSVMKVPIGGGSPVTLATGQGGLYGMAIDATSVYWTTQVTSGTTGTNFGEVLKLTPK